HLLFWRSLPLSDLSLIIACAMLRQGSRTTVPMAPGTHGCTLSYLRGRLAARSRGPAPSYPKPVARQLMLLYDGAAVSASMDHDPSAAPAAAQSQPRSSMRPFPKRLPAKLRAAH